MRWLFLGVASVTGCFASHGLCADGLCEDEDAATCALAPRCPAEWTEVPACEGLDCIVLSRCGASIACVRGATCDGEAICTDAIEVDSCEGSCSEVSACGVSVTCEPASCSAAPACAGDEREVERCAASDGDCRTITRCGMTAHCAPADCVAESPCRYPESEIEIDGCATPGGDSACDEQIDACGRVIGCQIQFGEDGLGGSPCTPRCEKHEERVLRCPPGAECIIREGCSLPIVCIPQR